MIAQVSLAASDAASRSDAVDVGALFEEHRERLLILANLILRDPDDAADIVQRVFEKAYRYRRRLDPQLSPGGWLTRLTCNEAISLSRRRRLLTWLPLTARHQPIGLESASEDRLLVEQALKQLSAKHRATVILFYVYGYSLAEIGGLLDVSRGTVASRLHHARTVLAALLESGQQEESQ